MYQAGGTYSDFSTETVKHDTLNSSKNADDDDNDDDINDHEDDDDDSEDKMYVLNGRLLHDAFTEKKIYFLHLFCFAVYLVSSLAS